PRGRRRRDRHERGGHRLRLLRRGAGHRRGRSLRPRRAGLPAGPRDRRLRRARADPAGRPRRAAMSAGSAAVPSGARVILASHNATKLAELQRILTAAVPGLAAEQVISSAGISLPDVVEDAVTFEGNALLKARSAAVATGLLAVADDSGLAVDVLGGAPGIFS